MIGLVSSSLIIHPYFLILCYTVLYFYCSVFERSINNSCPSLFEIFQQFENFPLASLVRFIISASIQLLSLLRWFHMMECGFNFVIDCKCCDGIFGFRVFSDDCDECEHCCGFEWVS